MHLLLLFFALTLQNVCPTFNMGETAIIRSADVFNGAAVQVFAPAWTATGDPVYIVQLLDGRGYISASGCDLEAATVQVQPTERITRNPVNETEQMLLTAYQFTLGESWIYGNAIGLPSGRPNEAADQLIAEGLLEHNAETSQYKVTPAGVQRLSDLGLI